jgi:acetylornithine/succinyldiaminopimelate/putrescine aminotransferase
MMVNFRQSAESQVLLARDAEVLLPVYARLTVVMERGEGVYLYDIDNP